MEAHRFSTDYRISSQQAKYIKFLQFIRDYPEFSDVVAVTYFDHKFEVREDHIAWILNNYSTDKSILIRCTPVIKSTISEEVAAAQGQERYALNMHETLLWVDDLRTRKKISENVRIVNTGIIHYSRIKEMLQLLDDVYKTVWKPGQPECQIIWAVLSQEYDAEIQKVDWKDLSPVWRAP